MRRTIFIQVPQGLSGDMEPQVGWVVQEAGQQPGPVFYGDLATASNHASGCKVVVLVSAFDVLLTQVDLPAMNKQRLAKAIPYALEEKVIPDLEELHFASGRRNDNNLLACTAVETRHMDAWLQRFRQVGLHPDVICTDAELVELQEHSWSILANTGQLAALKILVRFDDQKALALDLENLPLLLGSVFDALAEDKQPRKINLLLSDDQPNRQNLISLDNEILDNDAEATVNQTGSPAEEQRYDGNSIAQELLQELKAFCDKHQIEFDFTPSEQAYLAIMASNYDDAKVTNLLQGEYSRSEQLGKLFRPWRAAAAVLAAWIILQGGLFIGEYQRLAKRDKELRQQISQVFRSAFPETKTIVDPKLQMERGLKQLQQGNIAKVSLFSLLTKAGKILKESKSVTLTSMRYTGGKLDVDLEITDLESLDHLKERLIKEAELEVDIVSASARDQKVESRLQLKSSS